MASSTPIKTKILYCVATLTFLLGAGIGLAALSASLGVWLGVWPFGTGFQILGAVNPFTGWIALLCLVEAISLFIITKLWKTSNPLKLCSLPFIGCLAAAIAWYIPGTFQPGEGENFPPIHDISTDTINPPTYVAVLPLRADAPNTVVFGGSPNMTAERQTQMQVEAYPDIVPHLLDASEAEIFERAVKAVNSMGWELVAAIPEDGRIEATATTFWFRFKDDVVIRIRSEGTQTRVDARSLSRVGNGDVGANAKRLRKFFEIL